jgi:glycosyltransferase involved in cell wall biosynthesis
MLRIGFDAKRAFQNFTGLGNYSRSVLESLSISFPENEYYLYTPKPIHNKRTAPLFGKPNLMIKSPKLPFLKSLWRSRFVVKNLVRDKIQLYHGLSHEIPVGIRRTGIKTVVTIHDLIFLRYPQYYKATDRKIYESKFRHACKNADAIIAISEQTKRDIVQFFGTDPNKIKVIYQACAPEFDIICEAGQLHSVREKYHLPDKYLLNVGTVESRKNALLIAKAFTKTTSEIPLVIIGKETPYAVILKKYLQENNLGHRVTFLQDVAFTDLPAIYQQASIFVYPSEFEGFGIPILEALKSGVPVIAATGSCLEEAGGAGSIYINPKDETALANAIDKVLGNENLSGQMKKEGLIYASSFSESNHAKNLMQLYQSLLK